MTQVSNDKCNGGGFDSQSGDWNSEYFHFFASIRRQSMIPLNMECLKMECLNTLLYMGYKVS